MPNQKVTIITGAAPEGMSALHGRIPIHLIRQEIDQWLDVSASKHALMGVLSPGLRMPLLITPLSSYVGNSRNKDQRCIEALGDNIEVKGSKITFDGAPVIIAAEVKKGDAILKFRDENGFPAWAGMGMGRMRSR